MPIRVHMPIPFIPVPKLRDILLCKPIQPILQIASVPEHEQELQPHEQRRQENGLEQIVQQRGRAAFEDAVADELCDPGEDVDGDGVVGGSGVIVRGEVVDIGGGNEEEEGEERASDGLEEDVEGAVREAYREGEVEGEELEKWVLRIGGGREEGRGVCDLHWWSVGGKRSGGGLVGVRADKEDGSEEDWQDAYHMDTNVDLGKMVSRIARADQGQNAGHTGL